MPKSRYTNDYTALRDLLIQARKAAGLTQVELARKLKRPQSFVSKYERGERRLDLVEFLDVARALRIDPARFVRRLQNRLSRRM